ncbi:MAG TPA: SEC-C domain-containing protein [Verrucomicrobiae bacterium]
MKIGRNDLCHCGSGKKYKLCHLPLDEAARRPAAAETPEAAAPNPSATAELEETIRTLKELQGTGDAAMQARAKQLLARAVPLLEYSKKQTEIQAATQALQGHEQEFIELSKDASAFNNRIEAVFAEERFAPLRFTPDDLQRAFDQSGSPLALPKEKVKEHLRGIILQLADKDYRTAASASLLLSLPEYARQGRLLDGCIVLSNARATSNLRDETNPFLWQMFVHGYQAWTAVKQARLSAG